MIFRLFFSEINNFDIYKETTMKLTITQLRRIIKEEVSNNKSRKKLKEAYVTTTPFPVEALEEAVVAYLEDKMKKGRMTVEDAHEFLINEVESTFEMFSTSLENDQI